MNFKIYYSRAGFGLVKDAKILKDALMFLGYDAEIIELPTAKHGFLGRITAAIASFSKIIGFLFFYRRLQRFFLGKPKHVSIHLEKIFYGKLFLHRQQILIPNQEWFGSAFFELLKYIDNVWVKTGFAEGIFKQFRPTVNYIGFCSAIDSNVICEKNGDHFFSRVGMSHFRGAERLVEVWRNHPEWPLLKMVIDSSCRPANPPANVEYLDIFSRAEDYVALASSSLFHIYASEAEGFGHSIVEAMGYGAVVLVTDAPPMNEVVDADCALLIAATYSGQKLFSPRFLVNASAVENTIETVMKMDTARIQQLIENARRRPAILKERFYNNLAMVIKKL